MYLVIVRIKTNNARQGFRKKKSHEMSYIYLEYFDFINSKASIPLGS